MRVTKLLLPAAALFSSSLGAADYDAEGKRWWSHIEVLASDAMEGRNTGSEGHRKAAAWVASEFDKRGLKPAGTKGYLQTVRLNVVGIDESKSSLAIVRDGTTTPLKLGDDATLARRAGLAPAIEAEVVFCGYALQIPEVKHDDFAGIDVKGKIVVYLGGGPRGVPTALRAHYSSIQERWRAAKAAGAVGFLSIANPKSMDIPWERSTLARLNPTMASAEPGAGGIAGMQFQATFNPANADKLFAPSGHKFADLLALADSDQPLPHFALGLKIKATETLTLSKTESPNVAAMLPGSDSKLKNEYVVFSAHLDHLGIGQPINGDKIYNGAMDDASGVASLLEVATLLKEVKPKRSVLFVAVTGEEKGELGSEHFAAHPTVAGKNIVADINMDMFLPLFPLKYLEVQGLDESTLGDQIRIAAKAQGVEVQADKEPDQNRFIRSDQYSFVKEGIPALAFKFGFIPGDPEEKIFKEWLRVRYHAPSDDLSQPVDKAAAARFNHIIAALGEAVANNPQRPQWKSTSFFRRFSK